MNCRSQAKRIIFKREQNPLSKQVCRAFLFSPFANQLFKSYRMSTKQKKPVTGKLQDRPQAPALPVVTGNTKALMPWLVILVTALPLLFSTTTMDPLIAIRSIFISWFLLLYSLVVFLSKRPLPDLPLPVKIFFWLGAGYCGWSLLCSRFAINPTESIYAVARYTLQLVLVFFVTVTVRKEPQRVLLLCKALAMAAILHEAIGILQYFDIAFREIPGGATSNPADPFPAFPHGLMANRNLFGSAQMLLLPFALFVVCQGNRIWKAIGGISMAGIAFSVVISQTRSTWLGTTAMVLFAVACILILFPKYRKKGLRLSFAGLIFCGLAAMILLRTNASNNFLQSTKTRVSSLIKPSLENAKSGGRLAMWSKSVQMLKDHPLLGVGPNNWKLAVPAYGSEGTIWREGLVLPSEPHNVYLKVAAEIGIPGALFYFGTWALLFVLGRKCIRNSKSKDDRLLIVMMTGGAIAFAVDGFFSFPTERVEHSLYLSLIAGIILGTYARLWPSASNDMRTNRWALFVVAVIVFNLFLAYKKYAFEVHAARTKTYRLQKLFTEAIEEVEAGKSNWVTLDPVGEPLELQSASAWVEMKDYEKALEQILHAKKLHPNNPRIYTTMGVIYFNLLDDAKATKAYQQALKLAPAYDVALKNLAGIYYKTGNYKACIETIERMSSRSYLYIASLYNLAKQRLAESSK